MISGNGHEKTTVERPEAALNYEVWGNAGEKSAPSAAQENQNHLAQLARELKLSVPKLISEAVDAHAEKNLKNLVEFQDELKRISQNVMERVEMIERASVGSRPSSRKFSKRMRTLPPVGDNIWCVFHKRRVNSSPIVRITQLLLRDWRELINFISAKCASDASRTPSLNCPLKDSLCKHCRDYAGPSFSSHNHAFCPLKYKEGDESRRGNKRFRGMHPEDKENGDNM
uniref:Gag-pol polyprotein n=1 Tax=Caenorhabditis tropicalis TaxID=1561998 RepID=A0A1I7U959_9PELO